MRTMKYVPSLIDIQANFVQYVHAFGARTVSTLIITSIEGSNNDFVNDIILSAASLFIAGGDQYDYWTIWKDTRVQQSLQMRINNGTTIGGTSAGMAVLGEARTILLSHICCTN